MLANLHSRNKMATRTHSSASPEVLPSLVADVNVLVRRTRSNREDNLCSLTYTLPPTRGVTLGNVWGGGRRGCGVGSPQALSKRRLTPQAP